MNPKPRAGGSRGTQATVSFQPPARQTASPRSAGPSVPQSDSSTVAQRPEARASASTAPAPEPAAPEPAAWQDAVESFRGVVEEELRRLEARLAEAGAAAAGTHGRDSGGGEWSALGTLEEEAADEAGPPGEVGEGSSRRRTHHQDRAGSARRRKTAPRGTVGRATKRRESILAAAELGVDSEVGKEIGEASETHNGHSDGGSQAGTPIDSTCLDGDEAQPGDDKAKPDGDEAQPDGDEAQCAGSATAMRSSIRSDTLAEMQQIPASDNTIAPRLHTPEDKPRRTFARLSNWRQSLTQARYGQHETKLSLKWAVTKTMTDASTFPEERNRYATKLLNSWVVKGGVPVLILASAMHMGYEADQAMQHYDEAVEDQTSAALSLFFTACFCAELALRVTAERKRFVMRHNPDFRWNLFDTFVVLTSVLDEVMKHMSGATLDLSAVRLLRILRLARIIRIIRLLRFFQDLRIMVAGILGSMHSLMWALILLVLVMFVVATSVMQIISDELSREDHSFSDKNVRLMVKYYGSMFTALFTLYQSITGGISWCEVADPLLELSPFMGAAFSIYIAFGLLCVLNIVTGVFVDNTKKMYNRDDGAVALDEIDRVKHKARDLKALFLKADKDGDEEVTKAEFKKLLEIDEVRALLRAQYGLDVDQKSAEGLFNMFDRDGDDSLTIDEFIFAIQRFHGQASSLELAQVSMDQMRLKRDIAKVLAKMNTVVMQTSPYHSEVQRPPKVADCQPNPKTTVTLGRASYVLPVSGTHELD